MSLTYTHVVAVPGARSCVDFINPETGRTLVNNRTPDECAEDYPGAVLMTWEQYDAQLQSYRASLMQPPVEVDSARWWYLLEVLPPLQWHRAAGAESFKLMEFQTMDLTECAVRIGERYFTMLRPVSTTHAQLLAIVEEHLSTQPATT